MLTSLPKILFKNTQPKQRYYLNISFINDKIHVGYDPFFHEDDSVFSYWASYGKEQLLVEKTLEFIQKWLDDGNAIVRQ